MPMCKTILTQILSFCSKSKKSLHVGMVNFSRFRVKKKPSDYRVLNDTEWTTEYILFVLTG